MFTGLIEEVGRVGWLRRSERGTQLRLAAPFIAAGLREGDSVSVNGCCLTATSIRDGGLTFDLLGETLERTNLRTLRPESPVNLERALAADGRLGGHFVQGHIDCTARVLDFSARGADHRLEVELSDDFAHYAAFKGSVALNGISLTIAELLPASFVVWSRCSKSWATHTCNTHVVAERIVPPQSMKSLWTRPTSVTWK